MNVYGICLAAAVAAWSSCAQAQWVQLRGDDDPFAGRSAPFIALSLSGVGISIGFRCTKPDDLTMLMVTPERPTQEINAMLKLFPAKLLVIVDDRPRVSLDATPDTTPDGKHVRFESDDEAVLDVFHATASANRRIAAAVEMMGKTFYSRSFQTTNARRALAPLISGCKLPPARPG